MVNSPPGGDSSSRHSYNVPMSVAMHSLVRIGRFSRLAHVSIKTLRFYDSIGLFRPACVDPHSGYRLYCLTQLPALARIRLLRGLGCSTAEALELMRSAPGSADYVRQLSVVRGRLVGRVAMAERQLKCLDEVLRQHEATAVDAGNSNIPADDTERSDVVRPDSWSVSEFRLPATVAFAVRDCLRTSGSGVYRMFESAEKRVARLARRLPVSPFLLLHDMEYRRTRADVEVCIPVAADAIGLDGVRVVEAVDRAACVRFTGNYAQAPFLFQLMRERLYAAGKQIAGPVREVYLRFGADQCGYRLPQRLLAEDVRDYHTELQVPCMGARADALTSLNPGR